MFNRIMIEPIAIFSFDEITSVDRGLGGIYAIEHKSKPGFFYIGSAVCFRERWINHRSHINNNKHHSKFLSRVCKKHGLSKIVFNILEVVDSKEKLIEREQFYIDQHVFENLYNSCKVAGSTLGVPNGMLGKPLSAETRKKISEAKKGKPATAETIKRMTELNKGKTLTAETKKKMSEAKKGKPSKLKGIIRPVKTVLKISKALRKLTDEQAIEIFNKNASGIKRQVLVEEYGVTYYVISDLLIGKTYKDLNLLESK